MKIEVVAALLMRLHIHRYVRFIKDHRGRTTVDLPHIEQEQSYRESPSNVTNLNNL